VATSEDIIRWHRVFGRSEAEPDRAELARHLGNLFGQRTIRFHTGKEGWFTAEVSPTGFAALWPASAQPWRLNRYLASEEGIRQELNSWAAWVETAEGNPHRDRLMQHMINTKQVFTFPLKDDFFDDFDADDKFDPWCHDFCRLLARQTEGIYQFDGEGIFASDGSLLVAE